MARSVRASRGGDESVDTSWWQRPLRELVEHIVEVYHRPLEEELPALLTATGELCIRHPDGAGHAEVAMVHEALTAIWSELESHMVTEEQVVFPWILSGGEGAQAPIAVILHEHVFVYRALDRIKELTDGFSRSPVKDDANTTLLAGLAKLDRDLRRHQRLEEEVLFPRALGKDPE